jgi:serine/threonine protein kinase
LRHSLTSQHASAFDRFRREAEVTSSLRHPHIVQVVDFNQTGGGAAYFVMELLEGQNLRQHLEAHGPMTLPDVVTVIDQVASALQAVHQRGIVHRDLKPENIHLVPIPGRKEPFVKVLDFGISKVLSASTLTQESMLVGTPHYMAPEQARGGSDDLDGRTDQFALGAIAHELLTGRRIFEAESVAAIIYQVLHEEPPSLGALAGEGVDAAIRRALAKNRQCERICQRGPPRCIRPASRQPAHRDDGCARLRPGGGDHLFGRDASCAAVVRGQVTPQDRERTSAAVPSPQAGRARRRRRRPGGGDRGRRDLVADVGSHLVGGSG